MKQRLDLVEPHHVLAVGEVGNGAAGEIRCRMVSLSIIGSGYSSMRSDPRLQGIIIHAAIINQLINSV